MVERKVNVQDCPLFANTVRNRSCNRLLPTLTIAKASFKSQAYTATIWCLWKLIKFMELHTSELSPTLVKTIFQQCHRAIPFWEAANIQVRYCYIIAMSLLNHPLEGSSHPHMEIPLDTLETPCFISLILREDILTEFSGRITFS